MSVKMFAYSTIGKSPKLLKAFFDAKQRIKRATAKIFPKYYNSKRLDSFPQNIQIMTHSFCNSKCLMCPYHDLKDKQPQGIMEDGIFRKIINECANEKISSVHPFLMNEPLMDKEIFEKMKCIREKIPNATIEINTNASLLDKERAKKLADSEADIINFNIPGIEKETYERITGMDFRTTMNNVLFFTNLPKKRNHILKIVCLVGVLKGKQVSEFIGFWKERGFVVELVDVVDRAGNVERMEIKHKKATKRLYGCEQDRHLKWVHIVHNGDVILCCQDWKREVVLGNVKEKSIKEIWNSEKYKAIRRILSAQVPVGKDFLCNKCSWAIY